MKNKLNITLFIIAILTDSVYSSRFWGVIANEGTNLISDCTDNFPDCFSENRIDIINQFNSLHNQGSIHNNGWGIYAYLDEILNSNYGDEFGSGILWRDNQSPTESGIYWGQILNTLMLNDGQNCIIGHVRKASAGCGSVPGEDYPPGPHPFLMIVDGVIWSFAHNGTLDKDVLLDELVTTDWIKNNGLELQTYDCGGNWEIDDDDDDEIEDCLDNCDVDCETECEPGFQNVIDSEIYFFWIMKNIIEEPTGNTLTALHKALSHPDFIPLTNPYLFGENQHKNFVLSNGSEIFSFRGNGSELNDEIDFIHNVYWISKPDDDSDDDEYDETYNAVMSQIFPGSTSLGDWHELFDHQMVYLPQDNKPIVISEFDELTGIEMKRLQKGTNWIGFPRLSDNESTETEVVVSPLLPEFDIIFDQNYTSYEYNDDLDDWIGDLNNLNSITGYKLQMDSEYPNYYLPVEGERIAEDTEISLTPGENWVSYFLDETQLPSEAIPDDLLYNLNYIKGKGWFMIERDGELIPKADCPPPVIEGIEINCYTLSYGDMVVLDVDEPTTFQWQQSDSDWPPYEEPKPDYFQYVELPDYQPLIIENIEYGDNVEEIGAFVDNTCIGACRVNGFPMPLRAYTDPGNVNDIQFQVKLKNDGLGKVSEQSNDYLNVNTLISETSEGVTFVSLSMDSMEDTAIINSFRLHQNYPNPFNPITTIQFVLEEEKDVTLSVYNITGIYVTTLFSGKAATGNYRVHWAGTNDAGNNVSNGIYYYELKSADYTVTKKLVLLK